MTRINSAIPVKNLTDEHLLAEHREIKRLPAVFKKMKPGAKIPEKFCLGKGHVLFWMDKMDFILRRYVSLYLECKARGFKVTDYSSNWCFIPLEYRNGYTPTAEERTLLENRISSQIQNSTEISFHYYSTPITKDEAIRLLCHGPIR